MKWATNLHLYFVSVQREDDPENHVEPFKVYLDTIADILTEIAHRTTPNDKWELSFMGDILHVRSEKLDHVIRFGTWLDMEFNMETEILYPQHLVRMPDLFWKQILELGEYGKFEFVETAIPDSPPYLAVQAKKKTKSNLYRLVRQRILCEAQKTTLLPDLTTYMRISDFFRYHGRSISGLKICYITCLRSSNGSIKSTICCIDMNIF